MTTIAWDGHTLAGDTRFNSGGFVFRGVKIHRLSNGRLYGGSGSAEECEAVRLWLETGISTPNTPGKPPEVKEFVGIVIDTDRRIWRLEDKLVPFEVTSAFHAIGSGRDYAIAAMHLGHSAQAGVALACVYDVWTGGEILTLAIEPQLLTD